MTKVKTPPFWETIKNRMTAALLSIMVRLAAWRFKRAQQSPLRAQRIALRNLLKLNAQSEVAKAIGFDQVKTLQDLKSLPVCTPDMMLPYFERALSLGVEAQGIFGTSPIRAFIETSGSTGASRFVPINQAHLDAYNHAQLNTLAAIRNGSPLTWKHLLTKPYIAMTSVLPLRQAAGGVPVGYGSAVISQFSRSAGSSRSFPTEATRRLSDWHTKMEAIYSEVKDQDISTIMGFPRYIDDFTDFVLQKSGAKHLREIWPNLFLALSGAVKVTEGFKLALAEKWAGPGARFGNELHFCDVFSSTEGNFAVSWDSSGRELCLDLLSNVYQFREPQSGEILQINEVKTNHPYELLITTPGGLLNYTLGDLVRFTDLSTFKFEFAGRVKDEISLAGEQITIGNVQATLQSLETQTGVSLPDFVLWAEESPRRLHLVLSRPVTPSSETEAEALAEKFDETLGQLVDYYAILRKDHFYEKPVIDWVGQGFFRNYRARNSHRGQFKGKYLFTRKELFTKEYGDVV